MVLVAYMHGLRVSELVDLRWDQLDFRTANVHVVGSKQGTPSTHPILGDELRALWRLHREQEPSRPSCSRPSAVLHLLRLASPACSNGLEKPPSCHLSRTRICSGTPADTRLQTGATTRGVPRSQEYPTHGALYRAVTDAVQEFLAGVNVFLAQRTRPSGRMKRPGTNGI
jgi:integrase